MDSSTTDNGYSSRTVQRALHAQSILDNLNKDRRNVNMCNGTVRIGDVNIPIQCNVLSAASPYFRGLFSYDPADTIHPQYEKMVTELPYDIISPPTFELVLDYIYTGSILLNEDNIQDILQASDILLMSDLKEMCCDYMEKCICVQNCLGIMTFADRFSCPWVLNAAAQFLDDNFMHVCGCDEFLQLPKDDLMKLLNREMLCVSGEHILLDCVIRWTMFNKDTRQSFLGEILESCISLSDLDDQSFRRLLKHELVHSTPLEMDITNLMKSGSKGHVTRGYINVLVVTGGEGLVVESPMENVCTDTEKKALVRCTPTENTTNSSHVKWIDLPSMTAARFGHGLVEAGGCLYAVGGKGNAGKVLSSGEQYDPHTNTWTAIPDLSEARASFGLVAIDDKIYAIGGVDDTDAPLTSMEEYHIYKKSWRQLPDMNFKRAWSAYAVSKKNIYVIAGGIMGKLYESVECYDPHLERWFSVSPLKERRYDARAVGYYDDVFVFGGLRRLECPSAYHSGGSGMKFCGTEVYQGASKQWCMMNKDHNMCTMTDMSHVDSVVVCGEEILIIGQLCMGNVYHHIRAYHPPTGAWRCVVQNHTPNQKGTESSMLRIPRKLLTRN